LEQGIGDIEEHDKIAVDQHCAEDRAPHGAYNMHSDELSHRSPDLLGPRLLTYIRSLFWGQLSEDLNILVACARN
jgi:hypothetical protein